MANKLTYSKQSNQRINATLSDKLKNSKKREIQRSLVEVAELDHLSTQGLSRFQISGGGIAEESQLKMIVMIILIEPIHFMNEETEDT